MLLLPLVVVFVGTYGQWAPTQCGFNTNQMTQWGKTVTPNNVLPAYPRPQMVRGDSSSWKNLNGLWDFNGTTNEDIEGPLPYDPDQPFATQILVPFPAESCLSGIGKTYKHLTYKTTFTDFSNRDSSKTRVLLQFGAVDWQTSVTLNGKSVGSQHTGGYDSFSYDITSLIQASNELTVNVYDPSDAGSQPNGKQRISAINKPGGDTYTPSSGIWQTVWLEVVNDPKMYISSYKLYPTLSSVTVNVTVTGTPSAAVTLTATDPTTSRAVGTAKGSANSMIKIDISNPKLWDYKSPFLYDLEIALDNSNEKVTAYFGLRTFTLGQYNTSGQPDTGPQVGVDRGGSDINGYPIVLNAPDYNLCWALCNKTNGCGAWAYGVPGCDSYSQPMCWLKTGDPRTSQNKCRVSGAEAVPGGRQVRPLLNGKPLFLSGWLDQSFWPDGLYTAPTDDALKFDLQAILDYGMNGVRLHQKVNPERWYYYADKLGVIILQDMIQKYGGASQATVSPFMADLKAMVEGKFNHPSIVQWTTFNEGDCWNVFPSVANVVDFVRSLDPTRLVDADSGGGANNQHVGDVNDVHNYPYPGDPKPYQDKQYAMIGEYGGIGYFMTSKEWAKGECHSYKTVGSAQDFAQEFVDMSQMVLTHKGDISVVIYTQLSDIENECDGFVNYDRSAKWDAAQTKMVVDANQNMINNMWS